MITVTALFTKNSGEPATGLTLAEIDLYLYRRAKADGATTTLWTAQHPTEEIGGGLYTKAYTSDDPSLYQYFAYASYTGATVLDSTYALYSGSDPADAQDMRDAMKLAPTAGDPAAGSVDKHLDDILEDTGTTLPATLAAIKAKTDDLDVSDITVITGLDGDDMTFTVGATYDETITGLSISGDWLALYFTLKDDTELNDSGAIVQIIESNPGVVTDGLLYLNGAASTAAYGSLTVSQAAGTVRVVLDSAAAAQLRKTKTKALSYDLKELTTASGDNVITSGKATVQLTPTKTV